MTVVIRELAGRYGVGVVMRLVAVVLMCVANTAVAHPRCELVRPASPAAARRAPACHRAAKAIADKVTPPIVGDFELARDKGVVEVGFPCDGLGERVDDIVVETGSGHGGTLSMWRAHRRPDGRFDVHGLVYRGASMMGAAQPVQLVTGTASLPDLDVARAALTATIREVDPPDPPGTFGGISGSFSSNDFHVLIRLVDSDGRIVERRYTGYAGSQNQQGYLGLRVAETALEPITSIAPAPGASGDADRELFADRFVAAVAHFDDDFYWWVMERYVDLARPLGSPRVLAGLVSRMTFAKADRSHVDARSNALDAISAITGWDPRAGGLSDDAAAKLVVADCKPAK